MKEAQRQAGVESCDRAYAKWILSKPESEDIKMGSWKKQTVLTAASTTENTSQRVKHTWHKKNLRGNRISKEDQAVLA